MTFLERVMVARADEQMARIDMAEPVKHDGWAIKPGEVQGRANGRHVGWRRERCLACGARTWRGSSYCQLHANRVRVGLPVDAEFYVITKAEAQRLSSRRRFGGPITLARSSDTREGR